MELDVMVVTIVAGGLFGMTLGKFIDKAPPWVFWFSLMLVIGALLYVAST
jgi:hypothetical protein